MRYTLYLNVISLLVFLAIPSAGVLYAQEEISIIDLKKDVHKHANAYRQSQHLDRLIAKSGLNRLAQQHAVDMASGRVPFSHQGFNKRVKEAKKYFKRPVSMAENVYMSSYPVSEIAEGCVKGWIKSPGHNRNLKGNYKYTGIGIAKSDDGTYYVVQLYAK